MFSFLRCVQGFAHLGDPKLSSLASAGLIAAVAACGPSLSPEAHLATERSFLRLGVELAREDEAVRHVLAQRHLSVAAEVRGPMFIALGASTLDARLSAIRVLSPRGVVVAEDAAQDDLFVPGELRLLDHFPSTLGEYHFVAWTRIARGRDLGCATLYRVLPDGSAVQAVLDVSTLGPRACVADLSRAPSGQLSALVAFPGLFAGQTPSLFVELAFQRVPLGREAPLIPVGKIAPGGPWLEAERARVEGSVRGDAPLEERHAIGVARAAVALLAGLNTEAQVAAYRSTVGRVMPGSTGAALVSDTLDHLEHGWADPEAADGAADGRSSSEVGEGDLLIDPGASEGDAGVFAEPDDPNGHKPGEDVLIIEPKARP